MRDCGTLGRVAASAALAVAMEVSVGAQSYNDIGSGGPLWWFPENDSSYSRHHDRWFISTVEALQQGSADEWGSATSFPSVAGDDAWVSDVSGAPPNSACDLQNGTVRINVGPPHDDMNVPEVRTVRTPNGVGGFAGLQVSMHIGEWWQGMKYRGYYDDATARAEHFSGDRSSWNPLVFGWFDVRMKDGSGAMVPPPLYDGGHSVMWIAPAASQWQLHGGGGFAMPCLGISMVQMHGVEDGGRGGVWPPVPVGADGGECWSSARALVLRANSEARCEPNLEERYDYTDRFWDLFDAAPARPAPVWLGGGDLPPAFPLDYDGPHLMARRGEVAVFTVSELAQTVAPPVPWAPVTYPGRGAAQGATRSAAQVRFLDPNRVDPFGGAGYGDGVVELPLQDDPNPDARECIEMGESGWDAAGGTLRVDCAHGRENSPTTGNVNRAAMGYGAAERSREAGPVDNSAAFGGVATARRPAVNPWAAPSGFSWFEHGNATLGCLFLEADVNDDPNGGLVAEAQASLDGKLEALNDQRAVHAQARRDLARCRGNLFCFLRQRSIIAGAGRSARRAFQEAYGWEIIRDYREQVLSEMAVALASADPYGYGSPRQVLRATGRVLGHGGRACVTSVGGATYNEALIPAVPTFEQGPGGTRWAAQSTIPGQGGPMWYGPAFDGRGAHAAGDRGDHYSQFADVVGRTTRYSEAALPPGVEYPEEMRRYSNYNNVRVGSTVWRDFACKTAHSGYYGVGLTALGPTTESHRQMSPGPRQPDRWWKEADPNVRVGDLATTQYSSGTPCVGDPAYDVRGADGTRRCFDLVPAGPPNGLNQGDRYMGGIGAYSVAGNPLGVGDYRVEYSGDGASDAGRSGVEDAMRPTSYYMLDGSELFELALRSSFFNLGFGYRSLDVERQSVWSGYGPWITLAGFKGSSWLRTGESYEGVAPGYCSGGGCDRTRVPMDWGRLEHQGPLAWYGAIVVGGTGGCTLAVDRAGGRPDAQGSVLEERQRIVCLLPTDVGPDGRCPGENLP